MIKKRKIDPKALGEAEIAALLDDLRRRNYSPISIKTIGNSLRKFFDWLRKQRIKSVTDVNTGHIRSYMLYMKKKGLKPNTTDAYLRSVVNLFNYLEWEQQIFMNPARSLVSPKLPFELQPVPTEDEMRRFLDMPDTSNSYGIRDKAMFELMYSAATRRQETSIIKVSDINFKDETLFVHGKGGKDRVVPLGKTAVFWLKKYLDEARPEILGKAEDTGQLWFIRWGKPMRKDRVRTLVKQYYDVSDIETHITPHSIRRACVTHMLAHGAHPAMAQQILGHVRSITLNKYIKTTINQVLAMHGRSKLGQ